MLKQRVLTAAILIPLVILIVFFAPHWAFSLLIALITAVGAYEWARLCNMKSPSWSYVYVGVAVLLMGGAYVLVHRVQEWLIPVLVLSVVWWGIVFMWLYLFNRDAKNASIPASVKLILGPLVLLPSWLALTAMHEFLKDGPAWVMLLLVLIWSADSGAYFAGKRFGRRKLAPNLSPGKTLEGVVGGLCLALIVSALGLQLVMGHLSLLPGFLILTLATVVVSIEGDLFESMMKRQAGVKDSGNVLPGHGGVLDRIDSLTSSAPLFLFGLLILQPA